MTAGSYGHGAPNSPFRHVWGGHADDHVVTHIVGARLSKGPSRYWQPADRRSAQHAAVRPDEYLFIAVLSRECSPHRALARSDGIQPPGGRAVRSQHQWAPPTAVSRPVTPHRVGGRHRATLIDGVTLCDGKGQGERSPSADLGGLLSVTVSSVLFADLSDMRTSLSLASPSARSCRK